MLNKISLWEQHLNGTVIDSIREWEYFRSYDIPLTEGNNSIYFETDYGPFQINIFDDNNDLIIEKDIIQPECVIDIRSDSDQIGTVKIFPGNPRSTGEFALASSGGYRVFPYYKKALIIFFSLTIIFLIILIFKNIVMKKFPGKIRRNTQQK